MQLPHGVSGRLPRGVSQGDHPTPRPSTEISTAVRPLAASSSRRLINAVGKSTASTMSLRLPTATPAGDRRGGAVAGHVAEIRQ